MSILKLTKEIKGLYAPSARYIAAVDVPELKFLMIDGQIEVNESTSSSEAFQEALNVLSGISFTLKFMSKLDRENPVDYNTMPTEGLWQMTGKSDLKNRSEWQWTLMIMQPDHITEGMVQKAIDSLREKRGEIPALDRVRFETFHEGLSMQIMHVGSTELASLTLERMKDFAVESGYELHGSYHEIYISDPRHEHPDKERTIIRYPITKLG